VPTVRVTCPECDYTFGVSDARVGGLITCRDCSAEFRAEFAEDEAETPTKTRNRPDADAEPEAWKTDLPIRSPMPLLAILAGLQVLAAGFLLLNWIYPVASSSPTQQGSYYRDPGTPMTKTTNLK
jgi:hypothetical protein